MTLHLGYIYTLRDSGRVRVTAAYYNWVNVVYPSNVKSRILRQDFEALLNPDFPPEAPVKQVQLTGRKRVRP